MNICILVAGLPPDIIGGAEIQASRLAAHLAERHRVLVLTRSTTVPDDLARDPNCRVWRRCGVRKPVVRFVADIVTTLRLIHRHRHAIDVIIAYQTVIDGLIGVLAKLWLRIPVVVAVRSEMEYQFHRDLKTRLLNPLVFRHADSIAVQSARIKDELLKALSRRGGERLTARVARKVCIFPNGISDVRSQPVNGHVVLCVARLAKVKGVRYLVEAMRHCPGERLIVVGDGPEMPSLRQLAGDLPNVAFEGAVDPTDVDRFLSLAKVLVVPSLNEGFPNVILEAMARGIPVIATAGGGIPDLVKPGETGFLTEPGDAKAIASCINTLGSDPALRQRLGRNALASARNYSWPSVLDLVERELAGLIAAESRLADVS